LALPFPSWVFFPPLPQPCPIQSLPAQLGWSGLVTIFSCDISAMGLGYAESKIGLVPRFGIHFCCGTGDGNHQEPCPIIFEILKQF